MSLKYAKSKILNAAPLVKSSVNNREFAPTDIPAFNIALAGDVNGGVSPGVTMVAGHSKHFKSLIGLFLAKAYMDKYPEAEMLFYDSEHGASMEYFKSVGVDIDRVAHFDVDYIENLKFDIAQKLDQIKEAGDKVVIFIDSVGMLPSKKEIDDAMDAKAVADMTRAKALKSFARVIANQCDIIGIPLIIVNHLYKTMDTYSPDVVSGGTGLYLASQDILVINRAKVKDGKDHVGYQFKIRIEKSRIVPENAIIPFTVRFDRGISKWTGLFEIAKATGDIYAPVKGWWARKFNDGSPEEKLRLKEIEANEAEFYKGLFERTDFLKNVKKYYTVSHGKLLIEEEEKNDEGSEPESESESEE
jgi:RecA/RadA recombinase